MAHFNLDPAKDADQRGCGSEGHLEAWAEQRLRAQQKHQQSRQGHRPQGERPQVREHRPQHHRHHDESALGRDIAPRKGEVARGRRQRAHRRDLLAGPMMAAERDQQQRHAQGSEDEAGQQSHVQARNGQKMREVRAAQGLERLLPDATAVAGHQRRGKAADFARQPRLHVP